MTDNQYKIVHWSNHQYHVVGKYTNKIITTHPVTKREANEILEMVSGLGDHPKMWG